jgi:hypothetical protein
VAVGALSGKVWEAAARSRGRLVREEGERSVSNHTDADNKGVLRTRRNRSTCPSWWSIMRSPAEP